MINKHFIIVAITLLSLFFLVSCGGNNEDEKSESTPTYITTITLRPVFDRPKITVSGKLEAVDKTSLAFKISGRIKSIMKDVGGFVRKDELMASLDQDEIAAQFNRAELGFRKVERDYERVKKLYKEEAATREQYQDMTTSYDNAKQLLSIAEYNLKYSKIFAPFDGYVAIRRHEPGEMIQMGEPVFYLVGKSSNLKIESSVASIYVHDLKVGDDVKILAHAYPGARFKGKISSVGAAADPVTGTFPVEILVSDVSWRLKPGMVAAATIQVGKAVPLLVVPPESLVEADEDRGYLFVYNPETETVRRQSVDIGSIVGEKVVISRGVSEGELVVVEGAQFLLSGEKVALKNENYSNKKNKERVR